MTKLALSKTNTAISNPILRPRNKTSPTLFPFPFFICRVYRDTLSRAVRARHLLCSHNFFFLRSSRFSFSSFSSEVPRNNTAAAAHAHTHHIRQRQTSLVQSKSPKVDIITNNFKPGTMASQAQLKKQQGKCPFDVKSRSPVSYWKAQLTLCSSVLFCRIADDIPKLQEHITDDCIQDWGY